MSNWRLAKSLAKLRDEVNAALPNRSKISDGTIGDLRHQKAGTSDHLPNSAGVVTALDLTHDPDKGLNAHVLADSIHHRRDPRVKYVIWNQNILKAYPSNNRPAWSWHRYDGSNPHTKHIHISVAADAALYDDERPWLSAGLPLPGPVEVEPTSIPAYPGSPVPAVEVIKALQKFHGLTPDGITGPATWKAIFKTVAFLLFIAATTASAQGRAMLGPAAESRMQQTGAGVRYDDRGFDAYRKNRARKTRRWMLELGLPAPIIDEFDAYARQITQPAHLALALDRAFTRTRDRFLACGEWSKAARVAHLVTPGSITVYVEPAPWLAPQGVYTNGLTTTDGKAIRAVVCQVNAINRPASAWLTTFDRLVEYEMVNLFGLRAGYRPRTVADEIGSRDVCAIVR